LKYLYLIIAIKYMSLIYPRSPEECLNYWESGANKWRDEVRSANNFGVKKEYNIGDKVDTISFYFPTSEVHTKNTVVVEGGLIESILRFKSGGLSYGVALSDGSKKITSSSHLRLVEVPRAHTPDWDLPCSGWC
jgi:hypothetical protein